MKVYIETMGCQMNQLDSELVVSRLRAAGHDIVEDRKQAEVVLYNTCSVRDHAEQKVYSRLGADGQRKASPGKSKLIVGVLGCMAQREGKALRKKYPQVDIVCSPGQLDLLCDLIDQAAEGKAAVAIDPKRNEPRDEVAEQRIDQLDLQREADLSSSSSQAYVRVMRGCDNFCSYCIVPFVRGPERSREPGQIVEEVKKLANAGKTTITLLGQTVNSYKWQNGESSVIFSDLLERVSAIEGLHRLRFVTSYPLNFGDDILQAMRDLPNVCEYMHVPAQSGSDAMLKAMNRKYTRAQYDDLIDRAKEIVPDIVIASDFIVGFPGETEQDHQTSAELIRRSEFKNSFIFKYSPRPGTSAAKNLSDDIPDEVKKLRNNELLDVQTEAGLAHHSKYVSRTCELLVEGPSPRAKKQPEMPDGGKIQMLGRTRGDHIVVFDGNESLAGQYVNVEITDATALTLFGTLT